MTGATSNNWHHLPPKAATWVQEGITCPAGLYVVEHMTGIPYINKYASPAVRPHPRNSFELFCVARLLNEVPEFNVRFDELRTASTAWAAVVSNWPKLTEHLEQEIASGSQLAPVTTRMLNQILRR
ncbi:hypothetical protein UFOVP315_37 [uncultured Caudovirales phage]|uniref:Uncharacterized protein n=1 Tax=uncultured Caudovirales phage TaxID=2100421 RepID=A0A6J5LR06_9CAUD|nr:hypothetical protein UFOVP315_37 [uncultured Caudovirales phage]